MRTLTTPLLDAVMCSATVALAHATTAKQTCICVGDDVQIMFADTDALINDYDETRLFKYEQHICHTGRKIF